MIFLFLLSPVNLLAEDMKWEELIKAKNFYDSGLCQFTRYYMTLNKKYLASAISLFKDGIAIDTNFSKNYYALVSALEEYEPGSSKMISDNLRELLNEMFDPFITGEDAAFEIGSLELLGICMERIRTLELAINYGHTHRQNLTSLVYEKFSYLWKTTLQCIL